MQGLDGLGQAAGAGVGLLGLGHPANPLLAVGVRHALEVGPGRVVTGERFGQVGGHLDFARRGVELQVDLDLVPGGDPSRRPVLCAQRDEEPPAHPGHRGAVGVAPDGDPDRRALALAQLGDHLLRDLNTGRGLAVQLDGRTESHGAEYLSRLRR